MGKQVVVPGGPDLPSQLSLTVGDTARFWATGAEVQAGERVIALAGPSLRTSAHDAGEGPRPAGLPNTVQVTARQPGQALLKLFAAARMPGQVPQTHLVAITVVANAPDGNPPEA